MKKDLRNQIAAAEQAGNFAELKRLWLLLDAVELCTEHGYEVAKPEPKPVFFGMDFSGAALSAAFDNTVLKSVRERQDQFAHLQKLAEVMPFDLEAIVQGAIAAATNAAGFGLTPEEYVQQANEAFHRARNKPAGVYALEDVRLALEEATPEAHKDGLKTRTWVQSIQLLGEIIRTPKVAPMASGCSSMTFDLPTGCQTPGRTLEHEGQVAYLQEFSFVDPNGMNELLSESPASFTKREGLGRVAKVYFGRVPEPGPLTAEYILAVANDKGVRCKGSKWISRKHTLRAIQYLLDRLTNQEKELKAFVGMNEKLTEENRVLNNELNRQPDTLSIIDNLMDRGGFTKTPNGAIGRLDLLLQSWTSYKESLDTARAAKTRLSHIVQDANKMLTQEGISPDGHLLERLNLLIQQARHSDTVRPSVAVDMMKDIDRMLDAELIAMPVPPVGEFLTVARVHELLKQYGEVRANHALQADVLDAINISLNSAGFFACTPDQMTHAERVKALASQYRTKEQRLQDLNGILTAVEGHLDRAGIQILRDGVNAADRVGLALNALDMKTGRVEKQKETIQYLNSLLNERDAALKLIEGHLDKAQIHKTGELTQGRVLLAVQKIERYGAWLDTKNEALYEANGLLTDAGVPKEGGNIGARIKNLIESHQFVKNERDAADGLVNQYTKKLATVTDAARALTDLIDTNAGVVVRGGHMEAEVYLDLDREGKGQLISLNHALKNAL